MNYSLHVADAIIKLGDLIGQKYSPVKVMYMTYISQGYYLAKYDEKLFLDEIQAREMTVVIPNLLKFFTNFGFDLAESLEPILIKGKILKPSEEEVLRFVIRLYGDFPTTTLHTILTGKSTPYFSATRKWNIIREDSLKHYYKQLLYQYGRV